MINTEDLNRAVGKVIDAESSRYTNHPMDKGGPTKYGITLKTLQCHKPGATAEDVKNLTRDVAIEIFVYDYARPFLFLEDVAVFNFLLNASVNHGPKGATFILQRACGVVADGKMGPNTRDAALRHEDLLVNLVIERCEYYARILQKDHSQRAFAAGWFNRIAKDLRWK